ncbi:related to TGS1-trimethyl guanosine synthase [Sporisorium scitamineum]|uniref:Trimethylguanosine synthase n=1 Tax=Sporisorium scitamineum TaxID=49012 RepID=A0A127ZEE0_9BASI|nr:related to TGS1-trimethyl guanosine synthase [Sporisorium scitamineum]
MTKKRKRTSIAPYVQHLSPSSITSSSSSKHLNLSAYHPDLDHSSLDPTLSSEYHSLLPQCLVHPSTFPPNMLKYWRHRHSLFSLYSAGCLLDEQSWFSVTPESVAFRIARRCASNGAVVDLFSGAGGNAIQFAMTCSKVIAVEVDEVKLRLARWNARVYGVEERICFVRGDSIEFLQRLKSWREAESESEQGKEVWKGITSEDVHAVQAVFLSPPWGGVDYAQPNSTYTLSSIHPIDGTTLFSLVHTAFATNNIAYYLPRNTSLPELSHLSALAHHSSVVPSKVKVECNYVNYGSKLSSLTAYYGALSADWDDDTDDWRS